MFKKLYKQIVPKIGLKIFSLSLINVFVAAFAAFLGRVQEVHWEKITAGNVYFYVSIATFFLIMWLAIENADYIVNHQLYGRD